MTASGRSLHDVMLADRLAKRDSLEAEGSEIQRFVMSGGDPLGQPSPDRGGLLQSVAGEPVGEYEVSQHGVRPDDRVVVECIDLVMTGPGIDES